MVPARELDQVLRLRAGLAMLHIVDDMPLEDAAGVLAKMAAVGLLDVAAKEGVLLSASTPFFRDHLLGSRSDVRIRLSLGRPANDCRR